MKRLTHERANGIKTGYWSPAKKQELVDRLAEYENTGMEPDEIRGIPKWIPVEDGLPEDDECVLIQVNGKWENITYIDAIMIGMHFKNEGWFIDGCPDWKDAEVVAWMPLPEPYASEGGSYGK